ncbi:vacuolar protein sorting-associated protein VTA1 homolog [Saccoglossus kowalevskii]
MASAKQLPPLPNSLKALRHYVDIGKEHEARDPVVAYYCRRYAMDEGMKIDSKSPDARQYLMALMGCLEASKKELKDNESIHSEVVGQAHVENYALRLFLFADNEDRSGRFNKNVVKTYYKASLLFDVLQTFGELSEDIMKQRKYGRWKAAYIHECLKKGETPHAGPLDDDEYSEMGAAGGLPVPPSNLPTQPPSNQIIPPGSHAPPTTPQDPGISHGVMPGPAPQKVPPPVQPTVPTTVQGKQE